MRTFVLFIWTLIFSLSLGAKSFGQSSFNVSKRVCTQSSDNEAICTTSPVNADDVLCSCSLPVPWTKQDGSSDCIYRSGETSALTCTDTKFSIDVELDQATRLEIRDDPYNESSSYIDVFGLNADANTVSNGTNDRINNDYFKQFKTPAGAVTWDGRVFFRVVSNDTTPPYLAIRVLRPENLTLAGTEVDFQKPNVLSSPFIYTNSDVENELGIIGMSHLSLFPHTNVKNNPFRSDQYGEPNSTGQYLTYRFFGVAGAKEFLGNTTAFGGIDGESAKSIHFVDIKDTINAVEDEDRPKKSILGRFQAKVIVNISDTSGGLNSSQLPVVHDFKMLKPAKAFKTAAGSPETYLHGYEPSVSQDGRLIVYSGNQFPDVRDANGGMITYSFNQNPFSLNNWSEPKNIADMHTLHAQTMVDGRLFSDRYPVSKYPLSEAQKDTGGACGDNIEYIFGAYPWLSFDSSEVTFGSVASLYGPRRNGTVMVGARTFGSLVHVDGDINLVRGNLLNEYDQTQGVDPTESDYNPLYVSYRGLFPHNGAFEQVLLIPLAMHGSFWSPFVTQTDPLLPLAPNRNSYGMIASGSAKYGEILIPDHLEDLMVYFPMNEPIDFDNCLVAEYIDDVFNHQDPDFINRTNGYDGVGTEGWKRRDRRFNLHRYDITADTSSYKHVGRLLNATGESVFSRDEFFDPISPVVGYPFEMRDAYYQWSKNSINLDGVDGFFGNSIHFKDHGIVETDISNVAAQQMKTNDQFTFAYWVHRGDNPSSVVTPVFNLSPLFVNWLQNDRITFRLFTSTDPYGQGGHQFSVDHVAQPDWQHYAFTYKNNRLKAYVNGNKIFDEAVSGELGIPPLPQNLNDSDSVMIGRIGPGSPSNLSGDQIVKIDEFYMYAKALSDKDIQRLAWVKHNASTSSFNVSSKFTNLYQEFVDLSSVGNGTINETDVYDLGKRLFESTVLAAPPASEPTTPIANPTTTPTEPNIPNLLDDAELPTCKSCHDPGKLFTDGEITPHLPGKNALDRNAPTLVNLLFNRDAFLDGRVNSIEEQVLHPIMNIDELGNEGINDADPDIVISRIMEGSGDITNADFQSVFGDNVNYTYIAISLGRYIRGQLATNVPTTTNVGDPVDSIARGRDIFFSTGNCASCHSGPNFTDSQFHNIGLNSSDPGRMNATAVSTDFGKFRTPSLINLSQTGPYFHNGSASSLTEVLEHYNSGPFSSNKSPFIQPLGLSTSDLTDLENYLLTLTATLQVDDGSP